MSSTMLKKTLKESLEPDHSQYFVWSLWSVIHLPMPAILSKTVSNLGGMATPLGLMAMGAAFDWKGSEKRVWARLL